MSQHIARLQRTTAILQHRLSDDLSDRFLHLINGNKREERNGMPLSADSPGRPDEMAARDTWIRSPNSRIGGKRNNSKYQWLVCCDCETSFRNQRLVAKSTSERLRTSETSFRSVSTMSPFLTFLFTIRFSSYNG